MFEALNTETETKNGKGIVSASDQTIKLRKIGQPIPFDIAGSSYSISPPSFLVADLVVNLVTEAQGDVLDKNKSKGLDKIQNNKRMKSIFDSKMFLGAQLILYNSKFPNWIDSYSGLPPQEELDRVVTTKTLLRCSPIELHNLFDCFYQLAQPELPRQSFLKLGTLI